MDTTEQKTIPDTAAATPPATAYGTAPFAVTDKEIDACNAGQEAEVAKSADTLAQHIGKEIDPETLAAQEAASSPSEKAAAGFRSYEHLERFGHGDCESIELNRVFVFPKIDGTNASVWLDTEGKVRCGSRNRVLSAEADNAGFHAWLFGDDPKAVHMRELAQAFPHLIFYGEWLVPHTLKTYRADAWRRFYVFDVYDRINGRYVPWETYAPILGTAVDSVQPLCSILNPTQAQLQAQVEMNTFLVADGCGVGEGVVLKNYDWKNRHGRQTWAKFVRNEFREQNALAFGVTEKEGEFQVEVAIAAEYCTPTLVAKTRAKVVLQHANKLGIDMTEPNAQQRVEAEARKHVIPHLLSLVFHDLVAEEITAILKRFKNPKIDFAKLQRCCVQGTKKYAPDLFA